MANDKNNSSSDITSDTQMTPIGDLVDLADRTIDRTYKGVSKIMQDYGGEWNDTFQDTVTSALPSFIWGGRDQFNKRRDEWLGDLYDSGTLSIDGSDTSRPSIFGSEPESQLLLDTSKPSNMWAYPVPSTKQYADCKELQGKSVWTREGVWRCLFPQDQLKLDQELRKPNTERRLFGDYITYLDWKTGMRKALLEKRQHEREQLKAEWEKEQHVFANPKYISQAEAEKNGKKVISSSISTETLSKEDGSFETKKVVQKWYDDGTSSIAENISNSKDKRSGWFWK